jgi:6-phosphogluconolactonase (cycloisomerase 2 family)
MRWLAAALACTSCSLNDQPIDLTDAARDGHVVTVDAPTHPPDTAPATQHHVYFAVPGVGIAGFSVAQTDGGLVSIGATTTVGMPSSLAVDGQGPLYVGRSDTAYVEQFAIALPSGVLGGMQTTGASCTGSAHFALEQAHRFAYYSCLFSSFQIVEASLFAGIMPLGQLAVDASDAPYLIATERTGRYAYVANTSPNATLYRYDILPSGLLANQTTEGNAPTGFTELVPDAYGRFLYVADGMMLYTFAIDGATGHLAPAGMFPTMARHVVIAPNNAYLFTSGETNRIGAFQIDPTFGTLSPVFGSPFIVSSSLQGPTNVLVVATDSATLYEADFDHQIYSFSIGAGGVLSPHGNVPLGGIAEAAVAADGTPPMMP